ncbi:MAG: alpha/beta hydrolase [Verrucomicrobiales bacterium]|nr:alpha/beta hydrolase [Verrucomicrobiales bacterium]
MKGILFTILSLTSIAVAEPLTREYASFDSGPLNIDIHYPTKERESLAPLILWIHGGGWQQGSRENMNLIAWVTLHGYAIASIDYRLTNIAPFPAQLDDCRAALGWIRKNGRNHRLDPSRIVVSGFSAGAHLATLLTVSQGDDEAPLQGFIHFYGPSDLNQMARYATKPSDPLNQPDSNVYKLLAGPLMDCLELAKEASPVTYLDAGDPSCLILVGDEDTLMTQRQCKRLHEAALAAEIPSEFHLVPGAGHGGKAFSDPERRKLILKFLTSALP